ncbi:MAG TPA: ATP-binding protein [Methylibium sp.]|uniref:hybrid sensor histidine kinase/response regulator n=1 Tax=Methylibium sp. TaxID=2067992 RepID=UPI002DBA89E8|nr:ATP-binding protein [Methylibium sp.]HEU4458048.1 ATP-binding protein [Methylibium sp.]
MPDAPVRAPDPPVPALESSRLRTLARLRAVVALALLLPTLAFVAVAAVLYEREFDDARDRLDRAARIAQEHGLKLFDTNEMLLQRMLDLVGHADDAGLREREDELHARLKYMAATLPQVQGLFVHGVDSRMIANSRSHPPPRHIDYSDRSWQRAHLRGEEPVYVSEPLVSRLTGEAAFDISRRRTHADGSFAGTVHVSLRPESLTDFYRALLRNQPGLRLTVLRRDGTGIARWPGLLPTDRTPADEGTMRQIAAGERVGASDGPSSFDGTPRLRMFRQLGDYPLYVVASMDRQAVLAAWGRQVALIALFVFPTATGFAWMAWVSLRRTRDEFATVRRLEDETARRQRAELNLMQSQKLEAMGRLTGGVAHDFNNLLAIVGNSVEVIRRQRPELAETQQVAAIGRAVASGAKLTRQLLAFARQQALLPERMLLQERLAGLIELLKPLLGSGVRLEWAVDEDTAPIEVDAAELELALINLAVNAADAMQGRGTLRIAARNAQPGETPPSLEGGFVQIDVDDSGPGIAPALAERAFEPFFTSKPVGKGTGLGLSQVRALCQSTGGDARIEAAPGGGARVRLWLGRSLRAAAAAAAVVPPATRIEGRLLLVEDNDEVARATHQLLEAMGCHVQHVRDGAEALAFVESRRDEIDLVLSDIEMPGTLDGIALAGRLRERTPTLPVLLMTGYAVRLAQARKQQLAVLPKPCSPAVLAEAIQRALATRTQGERVG